MDDKMVNKYALPIIGIIGGFALAFVYAPGLNNQEGCGVYKVAPKVVTSFVLKPPPPEVVYKACPQVTKKIEPLTCEPAQVNESAKNEHETRHHRRRHWRRWR